MEGNITHSLDDKISQNELDNKYIQEIKNGNVDALNKITINARGYLISSEFIREVNDNDIPFEEVTIQTIYTPETQSKGTNSKVALKILFQMMKHKLFD